MKNSFPLNIGEIPSGRKIIIRDGSGKDILNGKPLLFEGELSLKTTSEFGSIWDAQSNNLMSLLASSVEVGGVSLPSGQFSIQGAKIWQKSEPLTFSLSAKLEMIDNAKEDVVNPSLVLMQTCLPSVETITEGENIFGLNIKLQTLIPAGPNLQSILNSSGMVENKGNSFYQNLSSKARGLYSIEIPPNWNFNEMIIEEVSVDYGKVLDEYGFPISAEITMEVSSMQVATTDMITRIQENLGKGV